MKNSPSFNKFIWQDQSNRKYLIWGILLSIGEFIIFKLLYPYPDFFDDSYSYIYAAARHLDINIWPIGYSKFLEVFHAITHSDTALVAFQYFLLQFALLYFYFTNLYFFGLSPFSRKAIFAFLFINPLSLYICNLINSDAIFAGLSILWFTQVIWIIERPRIYHIFAHAILLFLCFTVRNTAYYYPFLAAIAFLLSRQRRIAKLAGILFPLVFIILFIQHTQNAAYKLTSTKQFSLFTGWQLANNALYIYDQIQVDSTKLPTPGAREINRIAADFLKKTDPTTYRSTLESIEGNCFIKYSNTPLKQYCYRHYNSKDADGGIIDWAKASEQFEPFGSYIIRTHPLAYIRYFIWPNVLHYVLPPLSNLGLYNYGNSSIDPIAQHWFHFHEPRIHPISYHLQGALILYKALFCVLNAYFFWQILGFLLHIRLRNLTSFGFPSALMAITFVLLNFAFSVSATVNILRYQIVPMVIIFTFDILLIQYRESKRNPSVTSESRHRSSIILNPNSKV